MFKMADYMLLQETARLCFAKEESELLKIHPDLPLDLCGAEVIKQKTRAPLILDPSHAIGYSFGVPDIAMACTAFGWRDYD